MLMSNLLKQNWIIDKDRLFDLINEAIVAGELPENLLDEVKRKETDEYPHRKVVNTATTLQNAVNMFVAQQKFMRGLPETTGLAVYKDIAAQFSGYDEDSLCNAHIFIRLLTEQYGKCAQMIKRVFD